MFIQEKKKGKKNDNKYIHFSYFISLEVVLSSYMQFFLLIEDGRIEVINDYSPKSDNQ